MPARTILVVSLAGLALVAAGCGSKKQPTATQWANDFCSAVSTWRDSLNNAKDKVTSGNISKDSIKSAADDAKSATDTFTKTVRDLGKPPTQSGEQAQQEVNDLSDQIDAGTKKIKDSVQNVSGISGALTAASTVTATIATMSSQVQTTYQNLRQLDPKGELQDAFHEADACQNLKQ
jgi:methyl-accepting chemotaxis protein